MKKTLLLSVSLLLLTSQASAYKQESLNITVNNQKRNMVVFTPNQLPDNSPLFIVTHGMNQDPEYQYGSDKMYEMIDTAKFVIAYLRSDGSTWDVGGTKDQNFVIKTIDEMATRYKINKERVYWSGFSMGSMLIHHCIANMQNKIAAFAPTSGIQFSESPWNNCKKPVNLLECIAYGDDVFGYEQYGIHAYIENYAKHDKHTNYSKTSGYRPISSSWYDGDLERWSGGPNGGEVWLYSYNNGGHWPMDLNRHLIWNFCKRFSLNMPLARITVPTGETTYLCMALQEEATFPDITVEATAKAQEGEIVKAEFFDGSTLFETVTEPPYTATLTSPTEGRHDLQVKVTDSNGRYSFASCQVSCVNCGTTQNLYDLSVTFTTENSVPQDWYVSNGTASTTRIGGGSVYTSGPRLLKFTNDARALDYGLLIQNTSTGKEKAAFAKFGVSKARSGLVMHPGHYVLKYRMYNWNQPDHSPVTIAVEDTEGQEVASKVYTPTVNIGGDTGNRFGVVRNQSFEFDILKAGEYVIAFYTDAPRNSDFVIGRITLQPKEFYVTGISDISVSNGQGTAKTAAVYDLNGRLMKDGQLKPGLYIRGGRKFIVVR